MGVVHVAVTRRVRPGMEDQFDTQLMRFVRESISSDGVVGVHILRPPPDSSSREYGILRSFESEAAAERFYKSDPFRRWIEDAQALVDGEPMHRKLTGLEAFFRSGGGSPPPRWKMAIVTFAGVLPTVLFWSTMLGPIGASTHWLLQAVLVNACVVATLTWIVMPGLTWCIRGWLHPPAERSSVVPSRLTRATSDDALG